MGYPCNYAISIDRCGRPATYLIIWGCLENHISEFIVCDQHTHAWVQAHNSSQINCAYCYNPSADYLTAGLRYINMRKLHL